MTANPTPVPGPSLPHWIGVEIGPVVLRAGVYDATFRFLGKVKLSTKRERGPSAVIARIARCIQYAVDECELQMGSIQAVGVGVPGRVDPGTGRVLAAPGLAWHALEFRTELETLLRLPVFPANHYNLAALGIHQTELSSRPRRMAALFPGSRIGGALIEEGRWRDPASVLLPVREETPALADENLFAVMPENPFQGFRGKDFKKALRRENKAVEEFVRAVATRTGEVAAVLIDQYQPETIAIGGGIIEEMKDEFMKIIEGTARARATAPAGPPPTFFASALSDYAPLVGGALWAARSVQIAPADQQPVK